MDQLRATTLKLMLLLTSLAATGCDTDGRSTPVGTGLGGVDIIALEKAHTGDRHGSAYEIRLRLSVDGVQTTAILYSPESSAEGTITASRHYQVKAEAACMDSQCQGIAVLVTAYSTVQNPRVITPYNGMAVEPGQMPSGQMGAFFNGGEQGAMQLMFKKPGNGSIPNAQAVMSFF